MSLLFQMCAVMSVILSFAYGASISHADGFSFSKQQKVNTHVHTITDLANGFWNEISSKMYMGLDKTKSIEDTVTSNAFLNNDPTSKMNEDSTAKPADLEKVLETVFITSSTVNMATNESHNSMNGSQNNTFILPSITSFERDGECEETGASCFTWKILKIVGASVGAGFIVGLFSPVLFYFTITTLGCLSYGIIFISLAIVCKAREGFTVAEHSFTVCQEIGACFLQKMFSIFPVLLIWISSSCLFGWFLWPSF